MPLDQDGFAARTDVSRETLSDYARWEALLTRWNRRINLVAPSSLADFWRRHALDSWQICAHIPETAEHIVDFGSGAGFPGLSAAIHCKQCGVGQVSLIESAGKKASFLKTVVRELELPARVLSQRIENLPSLGADVITARAFAPLPRLLDYARPHIHAQTKFILLKGANVKEEIKNACETWTFDVESVTSITDEDGVVLNLSNVRAKED